MQDGDTVTMIDGAGIRHRIRIKGIDAPERGQPFAVRARANMEDLVDSKDVTAQCHKSDQYRRRVCKVMVRPADCPTCGQTLDVGHAQIIAGLAWWSRGFAREQTPDERGRYESAEDEARARADGLWRDREPVAPWDWRRQRR